MQFRSIVASGIRGFILWIAGRFGNREFAEASAWKAWQRLESLHWRRAILFGRLAVAADPLYVDGYRILGLAYQRADDIHRARETLLRGLEVEQDNVPALLTLGDIERSIGNYSSAEAWYRRTLAAQPSNISAHWALAQTLRVEGRAEEAERLLLNALELAPNEPRVRRSLGQVRIERGADVKALPLIESAVRDYPDDGYLAYTHAFALASLGQPDAAIREARRAVQIEPDSPTYQRLLGTLALRAGAYQESEEAFNRSTELDPEDADVIVGLGEALRVQGRAKEAEDLLRQAVNRMPANAKLTEALRRLLAWRDPPPSEA